MNAVRFGAVLLFLTIGAFGQGSGFIQESDNRAVLEMINAFAGRRLTENGDVAFEQQLIGLIAKGRAFPNVIKEIGDKIALMRLDRGQRAIIEVRGDKIVVFFEALMPNYSTPRLNIMAMTWFFDEDKHLSETVIVHSQEGWGGPPF